MTPELRLVARDRHDDLLACLDSQTETVLAGCAGTGKTTSIKRLLGRPGTVLCAPTAKAASRLKEVCEAPALTVHALIYGRPVEQWIKVDGQTCKGWTDEAGNRLPPPGCPGCACTARLTFTDAGIDEAVDLIVVDEASMIGRQVAQDIRKVAGEVGARVLWVGDPAQLPPVGDEPGVDLQHPDVLLDHVYRTQGGILDLATEVRAATSFADLDVALHRRRGPDEVVIRGDGLSGLAAWRAGKSQRMAIVHSNRQRIEANTLVRTVLKRRGPLGPGDRLIIRKNAHAAAVWNGEIYAVLSVERVEEFTVVRARLDGVADAATISFVVNEDYLASTDPNEFGRDSRLLGSLFGALAAVDHHPDCTFYRGEEDDCLPECAPGPLAGLALVNAQHGFVITCHASQGSEADEVGVLWTPYTHGDRFNDARSWLYTAVTRARRSLTVWTGR